MWKNDSVATNATEEEAKNMCELTESHGIAADSEICLNLSISYLRVYYIIE